MEMSASWIRQVVQQLIHFTWKREVSRRSPCIFIACLVLALHGLIGTVSCVLLLNTLRKSASWNKCALLSYTCKDTREVYESHRHVVCMFDFGVFLNPEGTKKGKGEILSFHWGARSPNRKEDIEMPRNPVANAWPLLSPAAPATTMRGMRCSSRGWACIWM